MGHAGLIAGGVPTPESRSDLLEFGTPEACGRKKIAAPQTRGPRQDRERLERHQHVGRTAVVIRLSTGARAARDRSRRSRGLRACRCGLGRGEGLLGDLDKAGDQLGATGGLGGEVDLVELCVEHRDVYDIGAAVVLRG